MYKYIIITFVVCIVVMMQGCLAGGVSLSASAGGGFYDQEHPDAARVLQSMPIINTQTSRAFLPVPGGR